GVGGAGVGGATGTDAGVDAAPATLTQIWNAVLGDQGDGTSPSCRTCHNGRAGIPNFTSTLTSFTTLVGVASESCRPGIRVIAGNAESSILVNKLRAGSGFMLATVCGGDPMPRGDRLITLDQLHMIESWINAGALNN
ncbi:MAG TPA: hypothetical protein VFH68_04250, partial [Polyangia bacterium]|nr:hypothetical protein [Polyangia bacterium]